MNENHELVLRFTIGPLLMALGTIGFLNGGLSSLDPLYFIPTAFSTFIGSVIFFLGLPVPHKWFEQQKKPEVEHE